jgi:LPS export ABC transporter protein LptC
MTRRLFTLLLAALLTGAAALLLRDQESSAPGTPDESPLAQDYDYYLSDMVLDRFNPDGALQYHLGSERVTHYPSPDRSLLDAPSLKWTEPGKPDWNLDARNGDLRTDPATGATRLLLQQDVVAQRGGADSATLDIRSDSLLVLPDAGETSTNDRVRIQAPGTRLDAAGMHAWLREDRLRLSAGSGVHD